MTPNYNPRHGHYTSKCLESARAAIPEAEIILSTWEGVNVEGLDYDKLVISKDPGYLRTDTGWTTNLNRQIVSTRNGLANASRPFSAKIRTDTIITGSGFLNIPRNAAERLPQWAIFSERILILERFSRDPALAPLLHHPSDIFQFGKTKDLIQLWDSLLADINEHQHWKPDGSRPFITPFSDMMRYNNFSSKYYDDQYIWLQCCRRSHHVVNLNYAWESSLEQILISESLLTANFKVCNSNEAGLRLPDRLEEKGKFLSKNCYKSQDWDRLTAIYQTDRNIIGQKFRVYKVLFAIWKHLILATTQRLLVKFLSRCIAP